MASSRERLQRDKEPAESAMFDRLKAQLTRAFAMPDGAYRALDADTVIKRGRPSGRTT